MTSNKSKEIAARCFTMYSAERENNLFDKNFF